MRQEERERTFKMIYTQKLGETDYERVREIKQWLEAHEQRAMLLAYLTDENPYEL